MLVLKEKKSQNQTICLFERKILNLRYLENHKTSFDWIDLERVEYLRSTGILAVKQVNLWMSENIDTEVPKDFIFEFSYCMAVRINYQYEMICVTNVGVLLSSDIKSNYGRVSNHYIFSFEKFHFLDEWTSFL